MDKYMKNVLLHTPEGVRDIYNRECERKLYLNQKIHNVLKNYGYSDIETPTFEFLIFSARKRERLNHGRCINFLIVKEIHWYCVRI